MDADTLKRRMLARLEDAFKGSVSSGSEFEFDAESAIYWYASDNYTGQNDPLYSILSTSKFRPGPSHRSVKDEGEIAAMMYTELKNAFGSKRVRSMKFRNPPGNRKRLLSRAEVDVAVWEERDRLHIIIRDKKTGQRTIAEWWDDDALQMFEDGFFKRGVELKRSVIAYAEEMGLLSTIGRNPNVRKNIFLFNNPGNAQRVLAENFVRGANSGVASSMYIHGNRIYSYGPHFPIAERHVVQSQPVAGTPVIIITNRKSPSKTTSGQIGLVKAAAQQAGMDIMYEELKPEAKGPAAYSNPGRVRKNIFVFNNSPRKLNEMERAAAAVGLVIGTWAPGDGQTRYRFFLSDGKSSYGDYHQGDGLYTALGRKDAMAFISAFGKGRGTRRNPLTHRETSTVVESARFHARMARSVTPGAPYRSHLLGVAEGQLNVAAQYGRGKNRGRAGTMVSSIDRMAMAKGGPYMRFSHKPIRRNPAACPNPCVRGDKLPYNLQQEVLRKYIYRWTSGNTQRESAWAGVSGKPRIPLITDAQWLKEHAFHVTKKGELDLRHHHAEPHYMADDWKKGDPLPNPLLQTVFAANPPVSDQWGRMTGKQRAKSLMFAGVPEDLAYLQASRSWGNLTPSSKRALEGGWLDTSHRSSGTTTVRRLAPVGANPKKSIYLIEGCKIPYGSVGKRRLPGWRTFRSPSLEAARAEANRIFRETGIVVGITLEGSRKNPLTRKESAHVLRRAREEITFGKGFVPGPTRYSSGGKALARAEVVHKHGPKSARGAARRVVNQAARIFQNPSSLRLPAPGTKMTVAQAMELARRIGDRALIKECRAAAKLQTKANSHAKSVTWKHLPMGSKDKIDSVVALTHYGDSPEDMYRPPKGSKKGTHMYRHKWGDGSGRSRPVPVLASPSGKMIVKVMGPGQKVGDWMRG